LGAVQALVVRPVEVDALQQGIVASIIQHADAQAWVGQAAL